MSNMSKFVTALIGMLLMAFIVSWEFFLFVVGTAGGRFHLWLALGAGISAGAAASMMFLFFARYQKIKWSKVEMAPAGPLPIALGGNAFLNTPASVPFDAARWAIANAWLAGGQADDRTPTDGSVTENGQTASGQRAFARRTHQLMFKKWSQARHD
jgi:hypothetical protein